MTSPDRHAALVDASRPDTGPGAALRCQLLHDLAGTEHLREPWDEAVLRADGSLYMSYDWVRTWWRHYGPAGGLRVFLFFVGGRLVAVLPLFVDTVGWSPLRLKVARLVGGSNPPRVFDPPVPEALGLEVFRHVLAQLFGPDGCDLLSLGPVSEDHPAAGALRAACAAWPGLVTHGAESGAVYSRFELPATMDEYFASLSKNERKHRRKYELRLLGREHETRVEVVRDAERVPAEFERFADQHRRQWAAEGRPGHFGAWPAALAFHRDLVREQATRGRVRLLRIVADDQVVASQYAYAFGARYYWELPAREAAPRWERFSLGPTAVVTMLAQAMGEGKTAVEGGLAHYEYKLRLGAKEHRAVRLRVAGATRLARARVWVFSAIRDLVGVAYQKVWYRRIAPRLPSFFWRPQWSTWVRLDF